MNILKDRIHCALWVCVLIASLSGCRTTTTTSSLPPALRQTPDKPRKRRPLFDFGSSDQQDTSDPPRLLVGQNAENYLAVQGQPLRIGNAKSLAEDKQKEKVPDDPGAILRKLDDAEASERVGLTAALMKKGADAVNAIEVRQQELAVHVAMLRRLSSRIQGGETELTPDAGKPQFVVQDTEIDRFLQQRYETALDRLATGDFIGARDLANALCLLAPTSKFGTRAREVRSTAKRRLLRETVLFTELVHPAYMSRAAAPKIKLRLSNRSSKPILLIPGVKSNGRIGSIELTYEAIYAGGVNAKRAEHVAIRVKREITIKPGGQFELDIDIPAIHRKERGGLLGRYNVAGNLRPFSLERGDEAVPYLIPIFPSDMYVIERRDFVVVRDPLASFYDRLDDLDNIYKFMSKEKRDKRFKPVKAPEVRQVYEQFFVAAVLAGAWSRRKALNAIEEVLPRAPEDVETVLKAALSAINGDPFRYSKEEWLAWLRRGKRRSYYRPGDDFEGEK